MSLTLRYAARSDRGLIREGNEDSVYAGPRLLAVADGMGGMAAGEVASNIVVGALAPLDEDVSSSDLVDALRGAIGQANETLRAAVESNPALEGMGTTLTAMLFSGSRIALAHVGDSRAYVLREGELTQITRDDTYVQMLVDEGRITADEATTHPQRSLLTRALDGRDVDPDFSVREARAGDRYLLCSDGLSGVVSAETIAEALSIPDAREAADRLVSLALRGGGPDNITCIVADIVDVGLGDNAPVVGGAAAHDRGRTSSATADSAAGRAALARPSQPEPENEDTDEDEPPRRRWRTAVLAVVTVLAVVAAGVAVWRYTQAQYYVGSTDGKVAIYQGVSGSLGGMTFAKVDETSDVYLDDLRDVSRRNVEDTIQARDHDHALEIVETLRRQQLPLCSELGEEETDPATTPSSPAPSSPPASPPPAGSVTPSPSPSPSPSPTPLPTESPDPGVNCREPR